MNDDTPAITEEMVELHARVKHLRQEHADLDAAIHTLTGSGYHDQMLLQRMKKRKLALKDRIQNLGGEALPLTPAEFGARAADDSKRFGAIIRERKITGD